MQIFGSPDFQERTARQAIAVVAATLILSIGAAGFFSFRLYQAIIYRMDVLHSANASSTENGVEGFTALLATDVRRQSERNDSQHDRHNELALALQHAFNKVVEGMSHVYPGGTDRVLAAHPETFAPNHIQDLHTALQLIAPLDRAQSSVLGPWTLDSFGLRRRAEKHFHAPYLESVATPTARTLDGDCPADELFIFIPSRGTGKLDGIADLLELGTKRDLVFGQAVVRDLVSSLCVGGADDLVQAYYISLAGSLQVQKMPGAPVALSYSNQFAPWTSLADRPYFRDAYAKGPEEIGKVHTTEPYVDIGGGGFVQTYSVLFSDDQWDITGVLCIDRRVAALRDLTSIQRFGQPSIGPTLVGQDHDVYRCSLSDNDSSDRQGGALPPVVARVRSIMTANLEYYRSRISGFTFGDDQLFSVPLGGADIAIYHFRFDKSRRHVLVPIIAVFVVITIGTFAFVRAIALYRTLLAAERVRAQITSQLPGGLVVLDGDGVVVFHNADILGLLGAQEPGLIGRVFANEFLTDEARHELRAGGTRTAPAFEFSSEFITTEGKRKSCIVVSAPMSLPSRPNMRMLMLIPSERLEVAIAAKFIHTIAHALKTPMQGILILSDAMRRRVSPEKYDRYFAQMKRQVAEFRGLTSKLLTFSQSELSQIRVTVRSENIAPILKALVGPFRQRVQGTSVSIIDAIPERVPCIADAEFIRIVFNNLLDNAVKYTKAGHIELSVNDKGSHIEVIVSDTGIGIPEDERSRVFDRLFRGMSDDVRAQEGIGIGLHMVKLYVEAQDGTVEIRDYRKAVESEKGRLVGELQGTSFVVRLKRA